MGETKVANMKKGQRWMFGLGSEVTPCVPPVGFAVHGVISNSGFSYTAARAMVNGLVGSPVFRDFPSLVDQCLVMCGGRG